MVIENRQSGVTKVGLGGLHRLWCFLFGFVYYLAKGAYGWAIISFFTANGLFIGFPLYNRTIMRSVYEDKGWRIVSE